uniref:Serine/threonine-protein phosphatase (EC) n=1 Tax=Ganoderma boninense TaxID=34458 RepID=A0A5K1K584_9APHY|nr:Serine/threonine-protein phosphatase (EC [Ganoderma boninense]
MAGTTSASVTDTYGAFLIGTYCALMLYGLVLHQSYHYFRVYAADARWIKALVTVTLILETIVTALNLDAAYNYLVTNYANPDLERPLYWYRPIVYCSVRRTGNSGWSGGELIKELCRFQAHNITEALNYSYLVSARNAAATVADSFMTVVLIYSLRQSRTGIKRTDSMLNVLVLYAVNTGLLISAFNVLCLVFGFVFPQSFTYIAVDLVASRLYANSLLAALTSRKLIAEKSHVYTEADGPFGTVYAVSGPEPSPAGGRSAPPASRSNEEWELPQMGKVLNIQSRSHPDHVLGSSGADGGGKTRGEKPGKSV